LPVFRKNAARAKGGQPVKRSALLILFLSIAAPAGAQESGGEPSALACRDFHANAARVLASDPDTLQVNNLLFEAARKGCVSALDQLFKAGASSLARDHNGDTALAIAASMGRLAFVKALLASSAADATAQLERANVAGSTPLILAALAGRGEVATWLINAGAKVDPANAQGETALSAAAFNGDAELAALLLQRGAKPDTVDTTGKGVIVYAAARGAAAIVEKLIDAGVDPNARYHADLTALMRAAGHADNVAEEAGAQTVKLLIARGAKIDFVDDRGRNALMIAAGRGHAAIVQTLLAAGADRSARDKAGKTVADLAATPDIKAMLTAP
jgi:uncharacterized protein